MKTALRRRHHPPRHAHRPARSLAIAGIAATATVAALAACAPKREAFRVSAPSDSTRRTTPSGVVVGGEGRYGSDAWLGIPYAKAPVGALRWRAPQPLEPWSGVRKAVASGAPCAQYTSPFGGVSGPADTPAGEEDCLTLNVWAPHFGPDQVPAGDKRLPVLVWIHGGGNTIGQIGFYEGGRLATTEGVIVVALQYRLGPFGWMRHASLRADAVSDEEASGNFGTLDQIRALEWVHDNVAAFGGDPSNVTIFGESAGGQNVYMLLLAPKARGLFQRAIAQSGGLWTSTPAEAENLVDAPEPGHAQSSGEIALRLLQRDGLSGNRDAAKVRLDSMSDAEKASYLRGKSARDILLAYDAMPNAGMIDHPRVFGDGTVLPAGDPLERFKQPGGFAAVPLVAGTNRDENKLFMFGDPHLITRRFWIFPRFVDENLYLASADHLARMWKATGADDEARAIRASGGPGVWVYRFDWDEEPTVAGADLSKMLGAAHGFEIPFVFGHFDLGREARQLFTTENEAGREELSRAMMSYWAQFARSGDPGRGTRGDLPEWTAWQSTPGSRTLVLDTAAGGGTRMTPIEETRAAVLAGVDSDPRLADAKDRCAVLRDLARWSRGFSKDDYAVVAACAPYPIEAAPAA
ncbi:MAG TPA: carboxylesterase family protein [Candidatus Binatia bacterium]|nr:carboxylesterase family protein [Candidatus Binatia bacterium]